MFSTVNKEDISLTTGIAYPPVTGLKSPGRSQRSGGAWPRRAAEWRCVVVPQQEAQGPLGALWPRRAGPRAVQVKAWVLFVYLEERSRGGSCRGAVGRDVSADLEPRRPVHGGWWCTTAGEVPRPGAIRASWTSPIPNFQWRVSSVSTLAP